MFQKRLLAFHEVSHRFGKEQWDLYQFSWSLHYGECVQVCCARPEQYEILWRLLQGNLKPKKGMIEEWQPVTHSADETIAARLNLQNSMNRALESQLFKEHLWVDGKRIHVQNALELLQIPLADRHKPLKGVAPIFFQRFLTLLFMAAEVKLLLGRSIVGSMDAITLNFFQKWRPYFHGAIVILGDGFAGTSIVDVCIEIDSEGQSVIHPKK